jgi:hypothetical protein
MKGAAAFAAIAVGIIALVLAFRGENGLRSRASLRRRSANSGSGRLYSITSSARRRSEGGIFLSTRPIVLSLARSGRRQL